MKLLATFLANKEGGDKRLIENYRCEVTKYCSGCHRVLFFNKHGKIFKSRLDIGRFYKLAKPKIHEEVVSVKREQKDKNILEKVALGQKATVSLGITTN